MSSLGLNLTPRAVPHKIRKTHGSSPGYNGATLLHNCAVLAFFQSRNVEIDDEALSLFPGLEIVLWAHGRRKPITAADISARFEISRAQAYRWLEPLRAVQEAALK